jgi:hypothetical protein
LLHLFLPVAGPAIEVEIGDPLAVELPAKEAEEGRELGEHQCLVTLGQDLLELRQEEVELGAGLVGPLGIEQAGMAGCLPEAEQRFQNQDLGASQALLADFGSERAPVMVP